MLSKREKTIRILCLTVFCVLVLIINSFHENWRDEAQAWLLARDLNFGQLIAMMPYEGHPCLWHLLLMPFAKLGFAYRTMNFISCLLVFAAAGLLMFKSPLPFIWQIIALSGSAFLYYMPVISRSYALIPLFLFMIAVYYSKRYEQPVLYGISIALLVQTHLYMVPMAGILSVFWLVEAIDNYLKEHNLRELIKNALGLFLPLISFILFVMQVHGSNVSSANNLESLSLRTFYYSFLWSLSIFKISILVIFVFALAMLYGAIRKMALPYRECVIFILSAGAYFILSLIFGRITEQKTAILIFMVIWLLWVAWPETRTGYGKAVILGIHLLFSLMFLFLFGQIITDIRLNYSDSPYIAEYIEENLPEDAIIFQNNTEFASSVLAYLDRPAFFSLETGEEASFAVWVKNRQQTITDYDQLCKYARRIDPSVVKVFLLVNTSLTGSNQEILGPENVWECVYSSYSKENTAIMENYALYKVTVE